MTTTVWQPGLQPERTGLAWTRTCVSMIAASAAVLRLAAVNGSAPSLVLASMSLFVWVTLVVVTGRRYRLLVRRLQSHQHHMVMMPGAPAVGGVLLLAAATLILCVISLE